MRNRPIAALACLLISTLPVLAGQSAALAPESFRFSARGNYEYRPDPRELMQIIHPLAPARADDYGKLTIKATFPREATPPYLLGFFYDDNNVRSGTTVPKTIGSRSGALSVLIDEREGHRFSKCWVDGEEVWSQDVIAPSRREPVAVDLTGKVTPGKAFELVFGLVEAVDSDRRLPGDVQVQSEGISRLEVDFARYETKSYWGDVSLHWGGDKPSGEPAKWAETIDARPVKLPPSHNGAARRMKVEKSELLDDVDWAWPVVQGIPLAQGDLAAPEMVLSAGQAPVAHQFTPMNRWQDGSIKWALLQFTLNAGNKDESLTLAPAPKPQKPQKPVHPVQVKREGQGRVVTLGNSLVEATLAADHAVLKIAGRRQLPVINAFELYQSVEGQPGTVRWDAVDLRRSTPWQAEAWLSGSLHGPDGTTLERLRLSVTVFADVPYVRLRTTVINQRPGEMATDEYGFRLKPAWSSAEAIVNSSGEGWLLYPGPEATLTSATRYFSHRWPNGLSLTPDTIDFRLFRSGDQRLPRLTTCLGEALTHEVWLAVTPEPVTENAARRFSALVETPPRLDASALLRESRVWGPIPEIGRDEPIYEKVIEGNLAPVLGHGAQEGIRLYGSYNSTLLTNFYWNTLHTLYTVYAMTGERRWFDWAERSVRHQINHLICHEPTEAQPAGGVKYRLDHSGEPTFDIKTQTLDALFDHWQMSGEDEARQLAVGVADFILESSRTRAARNSTSARVQGWGLMFLMRAYRDTLDERYLKEAGEWAQVALKHTHPRRGAYLENPNHVSYPGLSPFKNGILLTGLREFYETTADPGIGALLYQIAWSVYAETYNPNNTEARPNLDYEYSPVPYKRAPMTRLNVGISAGQAYAAAISGDRRLAEIARLGYQGFLEGRPVTTTPCFCYDLPAAIFWNRYNADHTEARHQPLSGAE
ncbi:MAG TPA: hypothetical protein VNQ90_01825 [Chthoniobacteraceae bacterium]|nr:hypothetical protein [Chthoniobacteraceae bacterium]